MFNVSVWPKGSVSTDRWPIGSKRRRMVDLPRLAAWLCTPSVPVGNQLLAGRERDLQQASLADRPSETQEEREIRIFRVPIPRPDLLIPPLCPRPFYNPLLPILPCPPEAPLPAPGNRIASPLTRS